MRWLRSKQRRLSHLYETEISQPTPLYFCLAWLVTWTTMDALCSRSAGNFKMQFNDLRQFPLLLCNLFAVGTISGKENPEQMSQTGCGYTPENPIPMGSESASFWTVAGCLPFDQTFSGASGLQNTRSWADTLPLILRNLFFFLRSHWSQWRSCKISFLKK